jgi:catalase-peroxidase
LRLDPQRNWAVNDPAELARVLPVLEQVQQDFNGAQSGNVRVSLADVIVLGGCAAVEKAAADAGVTITVPFSPGRTDATQDMTDADAMEVLEPQADGFRNYLRDGEKLPPEILLVERAFMLNLTAPEMAVMVAGMRALGANTGGSPHGVLTDRPGQLTNDFFVNLLDMATEWTPSESSEDVYEGRDRSSGNVRWTASEVDLVFGANSQLRAVAEVYAADDAAGKFVTDFVATWNKVMNLDRFDLA